ncbi:MAG: hypothetical protein ACR2P8_13890 [Myxococcota bacterium]
MTRLGPLLRRATLLALLSLAAGTPAPASSGRVREAAEDVQPLAVGAAIPAMPVTSVRGEPVDLAARVRERGALLVFYRGGW